MLNVASSNEGGLMLIYDMKIATQKMKEPETEITVQYQMNIMK